MRTCCATKSFRALLRETSKAIAAQSCSSAKMTNEIEFVTLLRFDSMDAVKEFAGSDETKPVIFPGVEKLLTRMEPARHYRVAI